MTGSSKTKDKQLSIADLLYRASLHVRSAEEREPWNRGWCLPEYRHSDTAAVTVGNEVMAIDPDGIEFYEEAVAALLKLSAIRARWEPNELWGIVASGIAYIHESDSPLERANEVVRRLRDSSPSLIALSLANVEWDGAPMSFPFGVIGNLSTDYVDQVNSAAGTRRKMRGSEFDKWFDVFTGHPAESGSDILLDINEDTITSIPSESGGSAPKPCGDIPGTGILPRLPVIWTVWVPAQSDLAFKQARRQLDNLIGVTLLLNTDIKSHGMSMVSGSTNKPGVRGLALDRRSIEFLLGPKGRSELLANPLILSDVFQGGPHIWESAKPIPLAKLLGQPGLRADVEECITRESPVASRIRVAARWYTEALWATQRDDAALALGVALDSLIGARSGLPGREMKERFAFLEPSPTSRAKRSGRYNEIFSVRSAIAHGGVSSRLEDTDFINLTAADVSWAAHRLFLLDRHFSPASEKELDEVFDGFRWGTLEWPTGESRLLETSSG